MPNGPFGEMVSNLADNIKWANMFFVTSKEEDKKKANIQNGSMNSYSFKENKKL